MHCDEVDRVSSITKKIMGDNLNMLIKETHVSGNVEKKAKSSLDFIRCWDAYVPTTYCYQFLFPAKLSHTKIDII